MDTAFLCLRQCDLHDFLGNALDLDIHLQGRHTISRSRHLEIHIPQMILIPQNIRQYGKFVAFLDQSHGNPGDMRFDRHTGIHQRQGSSAYGSH